MHVAWWQWLTRAALLALTVTAVGCSVQHTQEGATLDPSKRWVLLPVVNDSQTPRAGQRVEAMVATLLRRRGVDLAVYPPRPQRSGLPDFDDAGRYQRALEWARGQDFDYAVTGSVAEWRYKSGLDGEPAVGLTLRVVALPDERPVWQSSGARSGWGRSSLAGTGQRVAAQLLEQLRLSER